MTSLATRYLGLDLAHPIVPGASPLADDIDGVLRLEDAGAPAIVMRSIFEEQIALEQMAAHRHLDVHAAPRGRRRPRARAEPLFGPLRRAPVGHRSGEPAARDGTRGHTLDRAPR